MKEQFNAIQSSVMNTASKEMAKIGQNLIGGLEGFGLTPTQKRAVAVQIEEAVDEVEQLVGGKAKEVFSLIKDGIDKKLDEIDIIPKELRKQISNMCKGSVDQLGKLVNDAVPNFLLYSNIHLFPKVHNHMYLHKIPHNQYLI
jgi:hypothetical protein